MATIFVVTALAVDSLFVHVGHGAAKTVGTQLAAMASSGMPVRIAVRTSPHKR